MDSTTTGMMFELLGDIIDLDMQENPYIVGLAVLLHFLDLRLYIAKCDFPDGGSFSP